MPAAPVVVNHDRRRSHPKAAATG